MSKGLKSFIIILFYFLLFLENRKTVTNNDSNGMTLTLVYNKDMRKRKKENK